MVRVTKIGVFPTDRKVLFWVHPETLNYLRDYLFFSFQLLSDSGYVYLSNETISKMEHMLLSQLKALFYSDIYVQEFHCEHSIFLDDEYVAFNKWQIGNENKCNCLVFYISVVPKK